jgi:hypothetical protein
MISETTFFIIDTVRQCLLAAEENWSLVVYNSINDYSYTIVHTTDDLFI